MFRSDSLPSFFRSGPNRLQVRIVPNLRAAAEIARTELEMVLSTVREPRVGLATGRTFAPIFRHFWMSAAEGGLEFERLVLTHLDEYHGFGPGVPGSMIDELRENLLDRLPRPPRAFHPVPGFGPLEQAVYSHGEQLKALGPLDLQFLGLGTNGHIAFNEPGTPFGSFHHAAELTEATLSATAGRFPPGLLPRHGITTGPAQIQRAKRLALFAFGRNKAEAVRQLVCGPISPACPATLLRLHPNAVLVLDREAASALDQDALWSKERLPEWIGPAASLNLQGPVLVAAPHPDDAAISCGGFLASLPESVPIHLLTMTTGARAAVPGLSDAAAVAALREAEVRREARHFRATPHFLRAKGYDSGAFEAADALALEALLDQVNPAIVIAPAAKDRHPTHRLSRELTDAAVRAHAKRRGRAVEVLSFEGPWHLHDLDEVNAICVFDAAAEAKKIAALREHQSQLLRVPFDEGALSLARLRGIALSESHFGGKEVGRLKTAPLVELFVRERYAP